MKYYKYTTVLQGTLESYNNNNYYYYSKAFNVLSHDIIIQQLLTDSNELKTMRLVTKQKSNSQNRSINV